MTNRADSSAPATIASGHRAGAATSVGHRRQLNEDAHLAGPRVFLVADGVGGHRAGDVASRLAVDTFRIAAEAGLPGVGDIDAAVRDLHVTITAHADGERAGMGTTLVGATVIQHEHRRAVAVFHVGDSRCYRLVDGRLDLVTHDHTHVQELVDAGLLRPDEAGDHPLRNVVTRALGIDLDGGADVTVLDPPIGRLLLCSDGLWSELEPRTMGRVLAGIADPQAAADRLVELALGGAARDNITAVVVDLDVDVRTGAGDEAGSATPRTMPPADVQPRETGMVER